MMNLADRFRQLVAALASDDSSVTFTRTDLISLLADEVDTPVPVDLRNLTAA